MRTINEKAKATGSNTAFNFHIHVIGDANRGVAGVTVKVWYKPGFLGVISWYPDITETDSDGWAHFEKPARFGKMAEEHVRMDVRIGDAVLAEDVSVKDGETLSYTLNPKCMSGKRHEATVGAALAGNSEI